MSIKHILTEPIGLVGVDPSIGYIDTDDALSDILAVGYLNDIRRRGYNINDKQIIVIQTSDLGNIWCEVHVSNQNYSLRQLNSKLIAFDVTVNQSELASGGSAVLLTSLNNEQYKIRELYLNSDGTNFSGGSGDRAATISDGTTDFSVIPAATLQSLVNARWGDTGLPFPASSSINTSTSAGSNITIAYSGGSNDYTAGELTLSGIVERVAQ